MKQLRPTGSDGARHVHSPDMGLVARVLGIALSLALRGCVLLALLFAAHLLISSALPQWQRVVDAIERAPIVERQLQVHSRNLERERLELQAIEQRLDTLSSTKLRDLSDELQRWQLRIEELGDERDRVRSQIDEMKRQRDEYCASYNPLKRWACKEMRQRFADLTERLEPLLQRLTNDKQAAERAASQASAQLAVLKDPTLSPAEKLEQLGVGQATLPTLAAAQSGRKIDALEADVERLSAELRALRELETSKTAWLLSQWQAVKYRLFALVALALLLPIAQRVVSYFVLMPLVTRWSAPLRLAEGHDTETTTLECGPAQRTLSLRLGSNQVLRVRSEYARPVQGQASSQLLYRWQAPFISYASGLRLLTRLQGDTTEAQATLAAPKDPNSYLMRLDFERHPGVVVHPKHVVGVLGSPRLRTRWRILSLQAWATWQLRYILFEGTGSLIVEGVGDVVATRPGEKTTKIEQSLVMGFDSRLTAGVQRTEVFLPYLFGKTPLVDDVFAGPHVFLWQKSTPDEHRNPIARSFDALFSALGKLLGF